MTRVVHRPTRISSVVAILTAAASVVFVANAPGQLLAVGTVVGGVAVLALGTTISRRGHRLLGLPIALLGFAVSLSAVGVGFALIASAGITERAELLGLFGVPLIALGVIPLHKRVARRLVSAGLVFLVVGAVLSGLLHGTGLEPLPLLASLAAAVVAWDAGEQAINLGEQLGRSARTWSVEVSHTAGTTAFGGLAIGAAMTIHRADVTGLPIESLLLLLAAAVVLMVALYE